MALGHLVEPSATAPVGSPVAAADAATEVQERGPLDEPPDHTAQPGEATLLEVTNGAGAAEPLNSGEAAESLTHSTSTLGVFSPTNFPGEVLLRALLVEVRRDLLPRGMGIKTSVANVASSFGLETLPIRVDLNRLKQFRVVCVVEMQPPHTPAPVLQVLRGVSPDGVELVDVNGEITRLGDAEFTPIWSGHAYLFHRRGSDLKYILSRGKQSPEVRMLQQRLAELGYMQTDASGLFDDDTTEAVRRLQKDHALQIDGAAGPATKIVLYHLVGRSLAEVRQE
jgi:hypothetical protein